MTEQHLHIPITIIGAGISGLWLLNHLKQKNIPTLLVEKDTIGGKQTLSSQGIIHGGMKFSLAGKLNQAATAVSEMTTLWDACIKGNGEIDLTDTEILSNHHTMWLKSAASGLKSLISSKVLHSDNKILKPHEYPLLFQNPQFKGHLCALHEKVLNIPSLIDNLTKPIHSHILKSNDACYFSFSENGKIKALHLFHQDKKLTLTSDCFIFTAGMGNEAPFKPYIEKPIMQQRPLKMVSVTFNKNAPAKTYAHIIEKGQTPTLTITTHTNQNNQTLWYLGGELAEAGIHLSDKEQIQKTKHELTRLLPWVNFNDCDIRTHDISRAENENQGKRPSLPFVMQKENALIAFPTKLTLAPALTRQIIDKIPNALLAKGTQPSLEWPLAKLGRPVWDI